jgi:hypothetical protein
VSVLHPNLTLMSVRAGQLRAFTQARSRCCRREVLDSATIMGVCATCAWAHFTPPGPAVRYLPPMYDPKDFDPYVTPPSERPRMYMQQERSHYRSETRLLMVEKNYTVEGQGDALGYAMVDPAVLLTRCGCWCACAAWNETGQTRTYASMLRTFGRCRWLISLDSKLSAGQMVAEAAMLGVPTIAYRGFRSNGARPGSLLLRVAAPHNCGRHSTCLMPPAPARVTRVRS